MYKENRLINALNNSGMNKSLHGILIVGGYYFINDKEILKFYEKKEQNINDF